MPDVDPRRANLAVRPRHKACGTPKETSCAPGHAGLEISVPRQPPSVSWKVARHGSRRKPACGRARSTAMAAQPSPGDDTKQIGRQLRPGVMPLRRSTTAHWPLGDAKLHAAGASRLAARWYPQCHHSRSQAAAQQREAYGVQINRPARVRATSLRQRRFVPFNYVPLRRGEQQSTTNGRNHSIRCRLKRRPIRIRGNGPIRPEIARRSVGTGQRQLPRVPRGQHGPTVLTDNNRAVMKPGTMSMN